MLKLILKEFEFKFPYFNGMVSFFSAVDKEINGISIIKTLLEVFKFFFPLN